MNNIDNKVDKVICNKCEEAFLITDIKKKNIKLNKEDVLVHYFVCPNCNDKYIVVCEDKKVRTMKHRHEVMKDEVHKHMKSMFRYSDSLKAKVMDKL